MIWYAILYARLVFDLYYYSLDLFIDSKLDSPVSSVVLKVKFRCTGGS
jgi:hypothetical protein